MSFRFQSSDATVEAAVRRIACAELDAALAAIRAEDRPIERIVHEVRRHCKALRGLIRLVRPVFPAFAVENAALRDIARGLAGARDSKVLADTLAMLAAAPDAALELPAIERIGVRLCAGPAPSAGMRAALESCTVPLLAARVRAATWTLSDDGWDALEPGFVRTVKAARRAMTAFADTETAEAGHQWRKQAKYHWQHMRLLRGVAPGSAGKRAKRAVTLSDLLGERHDLDLFLERLTVSRGRDEDGDTTARLAVLANRRIAALDAKAIKLGKRLFGKKPRKLADAWRKRWRDREGAQAPT